MGARTAQGRRGEPMLGVSEAVPGGYFAGLHFTGSSPSFTFTEIAGGTAP